MKTGALIFAHKNNIYDYVRMAEWAAENVKRHLQIPITLITDSTVEVTTNIFDKIIYVDAKQGSRRHFTDVNKTDLWYNDTRVLSYDISPYDRTLVIDSDYVVASPVLSLLLKSSIDFLCHKKAQAIGLNTDWTANYFGRNQFPMSWATVMIFSKTSSVKFIFDSMKMVQKNWQHYKDLYRIGKMHYRNDYALSIALGLYTGHTQIFSSIPWNLITALPEHKIKTLGELDHYQVEYTNQKGKSYYIDLNCKDFHAMCKHSLGELIETQSRTRLFNSSL